MRRHQLSQVAAQRVAGWWGCIEPEIDLVVEFLFYLWGLFCGLRLRLRLGVELRLGFGCALHLALTGDLSGFWGDDCLAALDALGWGSFALDYLGF